MTISFLEGTTSVEIPFIQSDGIPPKKFYLESAGYDLFISKTKAIKAWSRETIETQLQLMIPKGCFGFIAGRSGNAKNNGLIVFNGIIDSGFNRKISVVVFNFSNENFLAEKGKRISQLILLRYENIRFVRNLDDEFPDTDRGSKGFGSSSSSS